MKPVREFVRTLADVVFPPVCLHCGGLVDSAPEDELGAVAETAAAGSPAADAPDEASREVVDRTGAPGAANAPLRLRHVCRLCVSLVYRVGRPCCVTCGHPFFGEAGDDRLCDHCEGLRPVFREGRTATLFKGPVRALVHELKYHHGLHVLADLEAIVRSSPHIVEFIRGALLVPVPLHPRKERERGYNQSRLLAETLRRAAGGTTRVEALLRRVVDTQSQTHFDRQTRRANLKNAFALAPGQAITPDLHTILVDDVFTTGSTLNACAGVLRREGCLNLDVVTFGHG